MHIIIAEYKIILITFDIFSTLSTYRLNNFTSQIFFEITYSNHLYTCG